MMKMVGNDAEKTQVHHLYEALFTFGRPSNQPIFLKMTTVEIICYWLSTIKPFIMSTVELIKG